MHTLENFFRSRRVLSMNAPSLECYQAWPNSLRDTVISSELYNGPENSYIIEEALLHEAIPDFLTFPDYFLGYLVNSDAPRSLNVDYGYGRFQRPNQPGDILFAGPTRIAEGPGPFHSIMIHFNQEFFDHKLRQRYHNVLPDITILHTRSWRDDLLGIRICQLMQVCRDEAYFANQHPGTDRKLLQFAAHALIEGILDRLLFLAQQRARCNDPDRFGSVQRAIDYLHVNLDAEIALDTLADIAGVSRCHFARLFKQFTGVSALRYHAELRLDKARQLLESEPLDLSILQIARQTGFYNQSHLAREFKTRFAQTPDAYRQHR